MSRNDAGSLAERITNDLPNAAALPRKNGELVFSEPWQSRAFGLAVALCERDAYAWAEFRDRLIGEIAAAESAGRYDAATGYYHCWLAALERLLIEKGICLKDEIERRVVEVDE